MLLLPSAALAERPDTDAPPGAPPTWLPEEQWVQERWMPFDERRLYRELRSDRPAVYRFLWNGDRTLLDLARSSGVPVRGLAVRLVGPRPRSKRAREHWSIRLARANRVLDQGHLAEHLIGHSFHQLSVAMQAPSEFGVSVQDYVSL